MRSPARGTPAHRTHLAARRSARLKSADGLVAGEQAGFVSGGDPRAVAVGCSVPDAAGGDDLLVSGQDHLDVGDAMAATAAEMPVTWLWNSQPAPAPIASRVNATRLSASGSMYLVRAGRSLRLIRAVCRAFCQATRSTQRLTASATPPPAAPRATASPMFTRYPYISCRNGTNMAIRFKLVG